jgi:hypothetical protein
MKLSEFAQMAEIIAVIGVVVSLIFVGIGVRENTATARATSSQSIFDSSRQFFLDIALSEDLSRIRMLGEVNVGDLSEHEAARFRGLVLANWSFLQNVWIQRSLGAVDERVWDSYERMFCNQLKLGPGTLEVWNQQAFLYDPNFVGFINDRCLSSR